MREHILEETCPSWERFGQGPSKEETVKMPPDRWQEVERPKKWAGFRGSKKGHWKFQELKEAWLRPKENGEPGARWSRACGPWKENSWGKKAVGSHWRIFSLRITWSYLCFIKHRPQCREWIGARPEMVLAIGSVICVAFSWFLFFLQASHHCT